MELYLLREYTSSFRYILNLVEIVDGRWVVCARWFVFRDGQKMSKRQKNYPDPCKIVDQYGADALRLYLVNSPVVRAQSLRFSESGVRDVLKDVFIPWYNAFRFLMKVCSFFCLVFLLVNSPFGLETVSFMHSTDRIHSKADLNGCLAAGFFELT